MPVRDLLSAASTQGAAPTDPYFYDVSLLLNGDGTNGAQNNTFTDYSNNNISLTRNGNLTQGSFNPYGTLWSNYFNGSSSLRGGSSISTGTGDFTVECWANMPNPAANTNGNIFITIGDEQTGTGCCFYQYNSSIRIYGATAVGSPRMSLSYTFTPGAWYHIAFVRSSGTITAYVNGTSIGTATASGSGYAFSGNPYVSEILDTGNFYKGDACYISNLRVTQSALYTSTFTPSTTPLTAISGVQFLTSQSNRFIDNSSNNITLTASSTPQVQPFSPFNPTSAYDPTTTEGSGYFSSNSYLNFGNYAQVGSSDFTWESWFYPTNEGPYGGGGSMVCIGGDGNGYFGFNAGLFPAYGVSFGMSTGFGWYGITTSVTSLAPFQWYHLAITRSSGNITIYFNGVNVGTGYYPNSKTGSENYIGFYTNHSSNYDSCFGYMAGWRLVIGSVVYSGNFTPPTTPPAKITNTALLPKFDQAGIYDYATQNDLQTVGNAQVSTAQSKFGTGSLYFDGGGYLPSQSNQQFAIGTGNFTIEGWFNRSAGTNNGLFQISSVAGGLTTSTSNTLSIGVLSNTLVVYASNVGVLSSTISISNGTWYHFALVRNGTTTTAYFNGTAVYSVSDSVNYTGTYLVLGGYYSTSYLWNGYIDDFRVTSGYARYTANFTPPTAALPTY